MRIDGGVCMNDQVNERYDIFVSYAHADDECPIGATSGWVTTFVDELKKVLRRKMGGGGANVWMDYLLAANDIVDPALIEMVRSSRTLVLSLSPGYLKSKWCSKELGQFLDANQTSKNKESVFVVEIEPRPREEWHPRLQALTPFQFFQTDRNGAKRLFGYPKPPEDSDHPYWIQINSLADLISNYLEQTPSNQNPPSADSTGSGSAKSALDEVTVWVAQPPGDLVKEWHKLVEAIQQLGVRTRPLAPDIYSLESAIRLKPLIQADVEQAKLLVQLFTDQPDTLVSGGTASLASIQASIARLQCECQAGLTYMRWRPPDIRLESVTDSDYQTLLRGAMACGFEQFRQSVLDSLQTLIAPTPKQVNTLLDQDALMICVSGGPKDAELCENISQIICDLGHTALTAPAAPEAAQSPQDYRRQFEEILTEVQGIILVYGQEAASWVLAKYPVVRKALEGRGRPVTKGVLDGPPPGKTGVGLKGKDIYLLDCRAGVNEQCIQNYIDVLREGPAHV
jgi:hypothetical protein